MSYLRLLEVIQKNEKSYPCWYELQAPAVVVFVSCGDPSRDAAKEAAELETGREMDVPSKGQDTTISKTAGGGTGVGEYKADTIISNNRGELRKRVK